MKYLLVILLLTRLSASQEPGFVVCFFNPVAKNASSGFGSSNAIILDDEVYNENGDHDDTTGYGSCLKHKSDSIIVRLHTSHEYADLRKRGVHDLRSAFDLAELAVTFPLQIEVISKSCSDKISAKVNSDAHKNKSVIIGSFGERCVVSSVNKKLQRFCVNELDRDDTTEVAPIVRKHYRRSYPVGSVECFDYLDADIDSFETVYYDENGIPLLGSIRSARRPRVDDSMSPTKKIYLDSVGNPIIPPGHHIIDGVMTPSTLFDSLADYGLVALDDSITYARYQALPTEARRLAYRLARDGRAALDVDSIYDVYKRLTVMSIDTHVLDKH